MIAYPRAHAHVRVALQRERSARQSAALRLETPTSSTAVDRNRAKRQLREAYRLQKHNLLQHIPADREVHLAFIWLADDP